MSKGDSPRPHDPARYRSEWERIFARTQRPRKTAAEWLEDCDMPDRPYGITTDVTIEFSLKTIPRNDPARGETGEET